MIGVPCLGICGVHVLELTQKRAFDSTISVQDLHAPWFWVASSKAASIRQLIALKEKFPILLVTLWVTTT